MKSYGQTVIEKSQEMNEKEAREYLTKKVTELDDLYKIAKELGTSTNGFDQAIKEIMDYVSGY